MQKVILVINHNMKLVYFNCQGLAEVSRFILAISGDSYEDFRYPLEVIDFGKYQFEKKEFDKDKSDGKLIQSMNKVPYLDFDGQIISQSKAIERFLARKYDMYGTNEVVAGRIDAFCEAIRDIKDAYFKEKRNPEGDRDKWIREELPNRLKLLLGLVDVSDNIFEQNYLFENRVSLADITLYHFITHFFDNKTDSLATVDEIPVLKNIIENVGNISRLQSWLNDRPNTNF